MDHVLSQFTEPFVRRAMFWSKEMSCLDAGQSYTKYFAKTCQWNEYRIRHGLPNLSEDEQNVQLSQLFIKRFGSFPCNSNLL
jgi:hypothetical protein